MHREVCVQAERCRRGNRRAATNTWYHSCSCVCNDSNHCIRSAGPLCRRVRRFKPDKPDRSNSAKDDGDLRDDGESDTRTHAHAGASFRYDAELDHGTGAESAAGYDVAYTHESDLPALTAGCWSAWGNRLVDHYQTGREAVKGWMGLLVPQRG